MPRKTAGRASDPTGSEGNARAVTVAVVSDVHANTVALEAVLSELVPLEPDLVVFGGDLTWGPEPEETLALVAALEPPTIFVRGNADRMLLEEGDEPTERKPWLLERHSPEALRPARDVRRAGHGRGRRARSGALLSRLAAERRGGGDAGDAGAARPRLHGGHHGGSARHGAHAPPVRPARRRDPVGQRGQRRDGVRRRARDCMLGHPRPRRRDCDGRRSRSRRRRRGTGRAATRRRSG